MEEKKDDDEISIDLSKIKNIFKRKEKTEVHRTTEDTEEKHHAAEEHQKEHHETTHEKEDEISIDFGKIKNIFKSEPHEEKEHKVKHETHEEKKDDVIAIDFSKIKNIKNIFKKSEKTDDDEVSLDLNKMWSFIVKHKVLLLLIIPIFLSIFLRIQPAYLPITDQWAEDSVMNSLKSQIRGQIDQQYPNLPGQNKDALVESELQKLLQEQKAQIDLQLEATTNAFKSRMKDDSEQTYLLAIDPYFWMRHARNILENGHPGDELRDMKTKELCDKKGNGCIPWDNHMYAPTGRGVPPDIFHAYFIAYLFKFFSFFNRDLGLMALTFYTPVIISALSVIPAFFITRRIAGNFAGFVAATIVAIHPSFLTRTVGGFADTDAYNVMFPLFIAWFFLEALEAKKFKNVIFLSAASGLFVGFYSMTWGGWWYIFDFILASTAFYVAYYAFVHKKELIRSFSGFVKQKAIKNSLTFLMVFFTVSALATTLFINYNHFSKFVKNPGGFAKLKEVGITTIWPNVFTTVAEQNPASLNNVVNQVGLGEFYIFMIALIGITLTLTGMHRRKMWFVLGTLAWYLTLLFLKDKPFIQDLNTFLILISIPIVIRVLIALWESDKEIDLKYAIFLVLWFLATTFASTKGIRFTLLLVPAFAIGLGISFGALLKYGRELISKNLKVNRLVTSALIIIILIMALGIIPVPASACGKIPGTHIWCNALNTARSELPSLNDAWRTSLERIKDDSKEDAIINSWWDFGHWFKFWADRAVTFDGTSQNTPQAHWIGKVLLTNNEKTAVGILRMLDCSGGATGGGTAAFGLISEKVNDGTETVSILNNIISKDKEGARKILKENFNDKEINVILEQTHCQPPENYFITSEDMVGKSGVWAHFGSWDFERGLIYNTLKKKEYSNNVQKSSEFLQERFGYSEKRAEDFYYEVQSITDSNQANSWIAPWPSYAGSTSCSRISNETFGCDISGIPLIFNPTTNEMYAESSTGKVYPHKVSIQTEEGVTLKQYDESTIPLGNGRQLGIALIKNGDSYSAVAMDSDLSGSMFTRMFYQEGAGLKHFKKFSDERAFIGGRIIVWKVDWEGKEIPIVQESTDPQNNTQQHQAME